MSYDKSVWVIYKNEAIWVKIDLLEKYDYAEGRGNNWMCILSAIFIYLSFSIYNDWVKDQSHCLLP